MAGSCLNADGGVADVRRLAVNEEVLKGVLQMATKRLQIATTLCLNLKNKRPEPVGAFIRGCGLGVKRF
jgi:hypothetical protein